MKKYLGLLALLIAVAVLAGAVDSTWGEFSVTSPIYVNWANGYAANITLANITNNFTILSISNTASNVTNNTGYAASFTVTPTSSNISLPANVTISFATAGLAPGQYNGTMIVLNFTNSSENATVVVTLDVPVNTVTNKTNKGRNVTASLIFWMNNSADYNITINPITNSTLLFLSGDAAKNMTITGISVAAPYNLTNNSNTLVSINVSINTLNTSDGGGNYNGWMAFNTSDGRQTLNVTLVMNLTSELLVRALSVQNQSTKNNDMTPGGYGNATLNATYQDGTDAGLVNTTNIFSVSGWMNFSGDSTAPTSFVQNFTYVNFSNSSNYYFINYSLPSVMPGGSYTMAFATTKDGNNGTGIFNYSYVNESGMIVNMMGTTTAIQNINDNNNNGTTKFISAILSNIGWKIANVTIRLDPSCASIVSGGMATNATYYVGLMAPGNVSSIYNIWNIRLPSTAQSCTISVKGESPVGVWAANDTMEVIVSEPPANVVTPPSNAGGAVAGNSTGSSTPATDLSILSWPKTTSVTQGESKTVDIKIKNSGTKSIQNIATKVDGIDAAWFKGTELSNLPIGHEYTLPVTFNIPSGASVKLYSITFVATSSNATARASAELTVLPNEASKKTINATLTNLTDKYNELAGKLQSMSFGSNVSVANATLNEAKALIDKANGYIKAGDWFNANSVLTQIQSSLNNAEAKLKALEGAPLLNFVNLGGDTATYLMAGGAIVIIAIGAVFVWMSKTGKSLPDLKLPFSKTPSSKPSAQPAAPKSSKASAPAAGNSTGVVQSLKEKLNKLKIKRKGTASYSYHYQPGQ